MHDKHQGSDLSEGGKEVLFHPPPTTNFILKNRIVIKEINADCSSADTEERSAFFVFLNQDERIMNGLKDFFYPYILIKSLNPDSITTGKEDRHKKFSGMMAKAV
jgi:hypothetical protein